RDDSDAVHHLVEERDIAWRLDDLHVHVIAARQHRRSGIEPHEAALSDGTVLRSRRGAFPDLGELVESFLRLRKSRWHAAIFRIDDERRSPGADDVRSAIPPELVVRKSDVVGFLGTVHDTTRRRRCLTVAVGVAFGYGLTLVLIGLGLRQEF